MIRRMRISFATRAGSPPEQPVAVHPMQALRLMASYYRIVRQAALAMVAIIASFGLMYAICVHFGVDTSAAILAAALAVGLTRRGERLDPRAALQKFLTLLLIGLAAGAIGLAFRTAPAVGAVLFTAGITLSVWLRNFGERARAVGRTIALPFIAMLVVPVRIDGHPGLGTLLVLAAGAIAFICAAVVQWFV